MKLEFNCKTNILASVIFPENQIKELFDLFDGEEIIELSINTIDFPNYQTFNREIELQSFTITIAGILRVKKGKVLGHFSVISPNYLSSKAYESPEN